MKHLWTILCTKASIDSVTKNISLIEVTEQMNLTVGQQLETYMVPFKSYLVTFWVRSSPTVPEKFFQRNGIRFPDGKILYGEKIQVDLTGDNLRSRTIAVQEGFPIKGTGQHEFVIEVLDENENIWKEHFALPIDVRVTFSSEKAGNTKQ